MGEPAVSVVIATRDRPHHLAASAGAVLSSSFQDFELVVVDQSERSDGEEAFRAAFQDPRLRYRRTDARGLSRARNAGIASARASLVVFTDDDCRVAPEWLERMVEVFASVPEASLVFGRVRPPEEEGAGVVPEFAPSERLVRDWRPARPIHWGIGANMGARRRLFEAVGPFDTLLGAGAPFPAGEDIDITVRALGAGLQVVHAGDPEVTHVHVRVGPEASRHWRGYGVGIGATLTKHVRLRTAEGGAGLLWRSVAEAGSRGLGRLARAERPTGLGFLAGLLQGSLRSLRHRIDRERHVYSED